MSYLFTSRTLPLGVCSFRAKTSVVLLTGETAVPGTLSGAYQEPGTYLLSVKGMMPSSIVRLALGFNHLNESRKHVPGIFILVLSFQFGKVHHQACCPLSVLSAENLIKGILSL